MGIESDIVKRLSSQSLGARADAFMIVPIFDKEEEVNLFLKNNQIGFFNPKEALKKAKGMNRYEKVAIFKVSFELLDVIKRPEIELPSPDLKNMTRKQREFLEEFLTEAQQIIDERQKTRETEPYAPTVSLQKKYRRAINDYSLGGCNVIEKLERIFAL